MVEAPLTDKALNKFHHRKPKPAKLKLAVQIPAAFDPSKPQRVLWVNAPINNAEERTAGNIRALGGYAKTALDAGWVVVAADTDLGNPRPEDNVKADDGDQAVTQQAVDTLAAAWPQMKTWQFASAGFSGGAKASFFRTGQLLAANLNVIGLFLGGCNQDMTDAAREETNFPKSKLRKVKVFISNGKADNVSKVPMAEGVKKSVERNFGKVELALYEGGHGLNQAELRKALDWFLLP